MKSLLYGGRMDFQIRDFNGYRIELKGRISKPQQIQVYRGGSSSATLNKDHKVQNLLAYVILKDGVAEQGATRNRYY